MSIPTLKQLRYFLALVEIKHFGRAAESCFVSQSAFSIAIQEMEKLLNVQLVDRTNRSVTITDIGKEVATQARLTMNSMESLVETAQSSLSPLSGKLKLGIIPTIAPFLFTSTSSRATQKLPGTPTLSCRRHNRSRSSKAIGWRARYYCDCPAHCPAWYRDSLPVSRSIPPRLPKPQQTYRSQ